MFKNILKIIVIVVATSLIVGGGVYFLMNNKLQKEVENLNNQTLSPIDTKQSVNKEDKRGNNLSDYSAGDVIDPDYHGADGPQDSMADWKTYILKNLSFNYAKNWTVIFTNKVTEQLNDLVLHVTKNSSEPYPDGLWLRTSNDRSGISSDYILSSNRTFSFNQSGDSYIKFILNNGVTIYAECNYSLEGISVLETCNKIVSTIKIRPQDQTSENNNNIYENKEFGIKFQYQEVNKYEKTDSGIEFDLTDFEGGQKYFYRFHVMKEGDIYVDGLPLSLENILNRELQGETEQFVVNGYEAVRFENLGMCDGPTIVIFGDEYVYEFNKTCGGFDELNEIIESIEFI